MADQYFPPDANEADFNFTIAGYRPKDGLAAEFDFTEVIYYILPGNSNVFTAVWADPDASRTSGKMYALSWGPGAALSIVSLDSTSVFDWYSQTFAGRANEVLTNNDTRDLNVNTP